MKPTSEFLFMEPNVGGICNFLGSVSPQQKCEPIDESVLQLSFIRENKE